MKKMVVLVIFSLFSLNLFAPVSGAFLVKRIDPVNPFGKIIHAIGKVETGFDTLAYNPKEEAVGYFQIRPIRLKDYNNRTGSNYRKKDLYDYYVSEKIFLYMSCNSAELSLLSACGYDKLIKVEKDFVPLAGSPSLFTVSE